MLGSIYLLTRCNGRTDCVTRVVSEYPTERQDLQMYSRRDHRDLAGHGELAPGSGDGGAELRAIAFDNANIETEQSELLR